MSGITYTTIDRNEGTAPMWTADRKLWLTEDGSRVVEDGDPDAGTLYATPGYQVSDADAERFGLKAAQPVKPRLSEADQVKQKETIVKARKVAADKLAKKPAANKQRGSAKNK
jgi:hypothetical protein